VPVNRSRTRHVCSDSVLALRRSGPVRLFFVRGNEAVRCMGSQRMLGLQGRTGADSMTLATPLKRALAPSGSPEKRKIVLRLHNSLIGVRDAR